MLKTLDKFGAKENIKFFLYFYYYDNKFFTITTNT